MNDYELLNLQACSFNMFYNSGCTQSLVVGCKYWVVPLISTRIWGYSLIILCVCICRWPPESCINIQLVILTQDLVKCPTYETGSLNHSTAQKFDWCHSSSHESHFTHRNYSSGWVCQTRSSQLFYNPMCMISFVICIAWGHTIIRLI